MISLLVGLLLLLPTERIYYGALSYAPLERVVERRQWQGTEKFDLLLATENCNDLARWVWVIVDGQVLDGLIVDCEAPEHRGQMAERGLVADTNLRGLIHKRAWVIVR